MAGPYAAADTDLAPVLDERWPGVTSVVQHRGLDLTGLPQGRRVHPWWGVERPDRS